MTTTSLENIAAVLAGAVLFAMAYQAVTSKEPSDYLTSIGTVPEYIEIRKTVEYAGDEPYSYAEDVVSSLRPCIQIDEVSIARRETRMTITAKGECW